MNKTAIIHSLFALALITATQSAWGMGRIPKKEHEAKIAAVEKEWQEKLGTEQARAQQRVTELEGANNQLLKDLESNKGELQKRVAELMAEKQAVEKEKSDEVDKLKSTYDNLMEDMKKEISQGSIQITQLQDKLSVSLVDKIVFNSGDAEINEQGRSVLKRVANVLKKVQGKQIRIEGHTDNIPIGGTLKELYPSNWELSTARATTVARYLHEEGGIDPHMIYAAGYGPYHPAADNSTLEGRAKNRRIEIALVPMETAKPASALGTAKKGQ